MKTEITKSGSVVSRLDLGRCVRICDSAAKPRVGDVVVVRALGESTTYGNLELASGRLAKIIAGDILLGALGKRRALKGFVGEVPDSLAPGDRLHLLNMGGVMGICKGHHSALSDAIELEVIGLACTEGGRIINVGDVSIADVEGAPTINVPLIVVAGSCMNSGKTVAATEIIKQAAGRGLRVAGAKISGIACLRDTLNMQDNGAFVTASFLDCGLPSTVDRDEMPAVANAILSYLQSYQPDLIVAELGDGIVGGYSVEAVLCDESIRNAISALLFCASDYVGVIGGHHVLSGMGLAIDCVAGSVTDSQMGEDFVRDHIGLPAGNARRNGERLFELLSTKALGAATA